MMEKITNKQVFITDCDKFVSEKLGYILHNNKEYYSK